MTIYISIGSNQGDRLDNLRTAVKYLQAYLTDLNISIILETKAILPLNAPASWNIDYLNMIACGSTNLPAGEFLKILQHIEISMGRNNNREKWAPRIIDLDILLFDNQIISLADLTIPHSELLNRNFLLHLLALMDSQLLYPGNIYCGHADNKLSEELSLRKQPNQYSSKTFGEIANRQNATDCFINSFVLTPKLVGIINITSDSFSDGNLYLTPEKAVQHAIQLVKDGASVIELGAQSSRPNNDIMLSPTEEWQRLKPVLDGLKDIAKQYTISIDSFSPATIKKALDNYHIAWINDVKGCLDEDTLKYIAQAGAKIVVMHSLSIPPTDYNIIEFDKCSIDIIISWAENIIKKLKSCGFNEDCIILDPGIGFGKSCYQNLSLLSSAQQLMHLGCEVLIGHSRKSFINSFIKNLASERDLETIAVSSELYNLGVNYIRVHNVKDHQRFFVAQHLMK